MPLDTIGNLLFNAVVKGNHGSNQSVIHMVHVLQSFSLLLNQIFLTFKYYLYTCTNAMACFFKTLLF